MGAWISWQVEGMSSAEEEGGGGGGGVGFHSSDQVQKARVACSWSKLWGGPVQHPDISGTQKTSQLLLLLHTYFSQVQISNVPNKELP